MLKKTCIFIALFILTLCMSVSLQAEKVITSHGLTLFGDLLYPPDFKNFNYVNPDAPKGGMLVQAGGDFNNLNGYITNSGTVAGLYGGFAETLMVMCPDEPNSLYGLLAETITYAEDSSWIEYKLRDIARWHDGSPVTPEDVLFSFETMRDHGTPIFKSSFSEIKSVEITGTNTIRFIYNRGDRNLIYRLSWTLPVFAKKYWKDKDFEKATVEPPLMSGPYKIVKIDVGNTFTQERVKNYWGKDIPVNKGRFNFDVIRTDVYRDMNVQYEAFMAGNFDIRGEIDLSKWITGYENEAVKKGYIKKVESVPQGTIMFIGVGINTRREKFKNPRVREALAYAFDWEWTNRTIFHGKYKRLRSYFENCELSNRGIPEGLELKLLNAYKKQLDPRIFKVPFNPPATDATQGGLRKNLKIATDLLKEAGWTIKSGKMQNSKGEPLVIELLLWDPSTEASMSQFVENLKRLGIEATLNLPDSASFWPKYFKYDWDIALNGMFAQSLNPGAEIRDFWGSVSAEAKTSMNTQGISDPVVDGLIEKIIAAKSREEKVAACRALDRVLLWKYYSIPLWYFNTGMTAYWDRFGKPEKVPVWTQTSGNDTWWIDTEKEAVVSKVQKR